MSAPATPVAERSLEWVTQVAATFPFGPWRGLDRVLPGTEGPATVGVVADAAADPDALVVSIGADDPIAVTTLSPKPMETELLEVATGAVSGCITDVARGDRLQACTRLLAATMDAAADRGIDLLVHRVDAGDVEGLAAAQAAGFRVCEATATWLADADAPPNPIPLPEGMSLSVHETEVAGALSAAEVEALAARTAAWDQSHLRADPLLDDRVVDQFYGAWIHNIASGRWCDFLAVVRHGDEPVGIQSERTDRSLLAHTGVDLRLAEWLVVLEPGASVGRVLMHAAGSHRRPGARYHWWETQLRNLATIRSFEATGRAVPIRTSFTLHAWPRRGWGTA